RSSTFYSPLLCFTRRATPDTSALSLHDALPISAVAGPELLGLGRVRLVQDDAVVVGQLLARGDVADGLDEDAVLARVAAVGFLVDRLAVRVAAVVDPAGDVAVDIGVDDVLVVEREQEGMAGLRLVAVDAVGLGMGAQLALVLHQALALGEGCGGEVAVSMDG